MHPDERAATIVAVAVILAVPAAGRVDACGRIPACTSCQFRRVGSATRLTCSACAAGYAPHPVDQRSCVCAPGFFWDEAPALCQPCGVGKW